MKIEYSKTANLPTKHGVFLVKSYKEGIKEHLAIYTKDLDKSKAVNLRIHSECLTGDALGSLKCDCQAQLNFALEFIAKNQGMLLYLRQEGRDIGLLNKINAYALQDEGYDTIEANHMLGFKADERNYEIVDYILNDLAIKDINLLTNNPDKLSSLNSVKISSRIPIIVGKNSKNEEYLKVKKEGMGHLL